MKRLKTAIALIVFLFGSVEISVAQSYKQASHAIVTPYKYPGAFRQESESADQNSPTEPALGESEFEFEREESPYDEPIETDRHDFTQSTKTVGRGVLQLEYGFLYAFNDTGEERESSYSTPELVVRYGLTDRIEFQIRGNYGWKFIEDEDDLGGFEDLRMDFKIETSSQRGWRPETAVELRFTAPTGSEAFTTGRVEGGVDFIYAKEIGKGFELAGSTGFGTNSLGEFALIDPDPNPDDHYIAWSQSIALGKELSSRSSGYFEWFSIWTNNRDEELSLGFLNFGVDYLLTNNLLFDVRVGWGLNEQSDNTFAGVGGAVRF